MLLKRLVLPNGHQVQAEIAFTQEDLQRGLMGRDSLAQNAGMLFVFPHPGKHPIWMVNTFVPLDILWMDWNWRIVELGSGQPLSGMRLGGNLSSSYALEIPSGCAQGVQAGQYIRFD
jgi:uncharacterized protein